MTDSTASMGLAPAHATHLKTLLAALQTDVERGLTSDQVAERIARYGRNQLQEAPASPWWKRLLSQFTDVVIWILIVAAIISGFMGEWIDTAAILAIVLLN